MSSPDAEISLDSRGGPDTCLVMPCYNEENRFDAKHVETWLEAHPSFALILVDDGSQDKTGQILKETAGRMPDRIRCLQLTKNSGKAEAVRQGALEVLSGTYDYLGYIDADMATPLDEMVVMREYIARHANIEVLMAARVQLLGRRIVRNPLRHYLGRCFATAAALCLGLRVYDTQCGAKLLRVSPAVRSAFAEPFRTKWIFDVEMIARYLSARRDSEQDDADVGIHEHPVQAWQDVSGSKVKPHHFLIAFIDIINIYRKYGRPGIRRST